MTCELGFEGWVEFHRAVKGGAVAQEEGATCKKTPGGGCFRLGLLRSSECKVEGFYIEVTLKGKIVNVG